MNTRVLQCRQWEVYKTLEARCPYCRRVNQCKGIDGIERGDEVRCRGCKKSFILGRSIF